MAKWTAQSILAGAEHMKLGYISRVAPANPVDHVILATQFFKPKELAVQINLGLTNMWGVVKMICELLLSKPDGKYALIKDPNKSTLRLYELPASAFEEDDGEKAGDAAEGIAEEEEGEEES